MKEKTEKWLKEQRDKLEENLRKEGHLSNKGNGSYMFWDIENCGEFNAINNALSDGANITDLVVKSITKKNGNIKPPCDNCVAMYKDFVEFLF